MLPIVVRERFGLASHQVIEVALIGCVRFLAREHNHGTLDFLVALIIGSHGAESKSMLSMSLEFMAFGFQALLALIGISLAIQVII